MNTKTIVTAAGYLAALLIGTMGIFAMADEAKGPFDRVSVVLPKKASPVVTNIVTVLTRQITQRCAARITNSGDAPLVVELTLAPRIGSEGFRSEDRPDGGVRIVGNDERGLLYGAGKFLRTSRYDQGGFSPGSWRGTSVPQKTVRGIYFATHFHNFYHDAPIEEVQRYVEDLGLWGFNVLGFWYDMRYAGDGFDDPKAKQLRKRLSAIGQAAKRSGLDVALLFIANESYESAPAALRADAKGMRGAHPRFARRPLVFHHSAQRHSQKQAPAHRYNRHGHAAAPGLRAS